MLTRACQTEKTVLRSGLRIPPIFLNSGEWHSEFYGAALQQTKVRHG